MGIRRENGYSATVAAYLSVGSRRVDIAKMNRENLTLADSCELAPQTEAQLNIIVDDRTTSQMISLVDGATTGHREVRYSILAPF
jgi:hypothetical protein